MNATKMPNTLPAVKAGGTLRPPRSEYLKHLLINTPVEGLFHGIRHRQKMKYLKGHPELRELFEEDGWMERALGRIVKPDTNCVDVGGHLGSMLATLSRLAPGGRHAVVEPVPYKAKWLEGKFPGVSVFNCAVSDKAGVVTFHVNVNQSAKSTIQPTAEDLSQCVTLEVPLRTLDELLPRDYNPGLVKVDVEGAEKFVLEGMKEIVARAKPAIVFESTADGLLGFGLTTADNFEAVGRLGYAIYLFVDYLEGKGPLTVEQFGKAHEYPPKARNFLALPRAE
jgi:FkbM family methyltransferase